MMASSRRAAFLDRDGVINVDAGYVGHRNDFVFIEGAKEALARLVAADYLLVVVTNQSGIARGYYTEADFKTLTDYMCDELAAAGAPVARVFHCPHLPSDRCDCRKPASGMILTAAADLSIDLSMSVMIGDKPSDIAAGRTAGVGRCFLIGANPDMPSVLPDGQFPDLVGCVRHVLA
jgi:D-glycero-D-manno-heptose 1,7-bisphosphate phosphatase